LRLKGETTTYCLPVPPPLCGISHHTQAWYHLGDQEMVQRGLASRSGPDARLGSIVGGALKLTVPWTWAVPGLVARYLFPADLGCTADPGACVCKM